MIVRAMLAVLAVCCSPFALAQCLRDAAPIVELDRQYQDAVFRNDADAIARLLPDDFALVTGRGKVIGKQDLVREARERLAEYERQHDSRQSVRFIDGIAVISAMLHAKGRQDGQPFDYRLWFSDVYLCTPSGWRYSFAQSSLPLPD
jgi:ketosteroid isomerase-like protein